MVDPYRVEEVMSHPMTQRIFRYLTRRRKNGQTLLEEAMVSYGVDNGRMDFSLEEWLSVVPLQLAIWVLRKWGLDISKEVLRDGVLGHVPNRRAIVNALRSVGELGLRRPQVFLSPLLVVWNFTSACNLRCRHCYQSAGRPLGDELTLEEQLDIVDQMAEADVSMLAFSGGEPLMGRNFWEVAAYARDRGMHTSLATNGTLLTPEVVARLREIGIAYVQVSLDSTRAERHDWFRGIPGAWRRAVQGIEYAVAGKEHTAVGMAVTLMRWNFDELEDLLRLGIDLGVDEFYLYNFIPVGKGADMVQGDLTPEMREEALHTLYRYYSTGRISAFSTCPQYGRVCLMDAPEGGKMAVGHYGAEIGERAKVLAQYIGGCGAGRAYCCIEPNGIVTPCVFMKYPVGDLRKERFVDIWRNSSVMETLRDRDKLDEHCRICDYRSVCGGCRARAYNYFGDITAADPGCIHNMAQWQSLVRAA